MKSDTAELTNLELLAAEAQVYETLQQEHAAYVAAEAPLREEVEATINLLRHLPASTFVLGLEDGASAEDQAKFAWLSDRRGRLEVLPAAVAEVKRSLNASAREVLRLCDLIYHEVHVAACDRYRTERAQATLELADRCGKDPFRVKSAVDAVMAASEARRWRDDFTPLTLPKEPLDRARRIKVCRECFDSGKTLSAAFK